MYLYIPEQNEGGFCPLIEGRGIIGDIGRLQVCLEQGVYMREESQCRERLGQVLLCHVQRSALFPLSFPPMPPRDAGETNKREEKKGPLSIYLSAVALFFPHPPPARLVRREFIWKLLGLASSFILFFFSSILTHTFQGNFTIRDKEQSTDDTLNHCISFAFFCPLLMHTLLLFILFFLV